ncbi:MAG: FecR family protein [Chitinophagaceae bacterium]|nr:FecR family protein [Chitinophagaceae bacterium]
MQGEAIYKYLLQRYITNTQTQAELEQLYVLTLSGRFDEVLKQEAITIWNNKAVEALQKETLDSRKQFIYQYIKKFIQHNQAVSFHRQQQGPRRQWRRWALAVPALCAVAALAIWFVVNPAIKGQLAKAQPEFVIYENLTAQPSKLMLNDGSQVVLTKGSSLQFYANHPTGSRLAILKGSAWFTIEPTPDKKPFIVQKNSLQTEVLGTSFWVESIDGDKGTLVRVLSGKVKVTEIKKGAQADSKSAEAMLVMPNQQLHFEEASGSMQIGLTGTIMPLANTHIDTPVVSLDFTHGITLKKLMEVIEAAYGVTVTCSNKALYDCELQGDFSGKELHRLLDIICLTLNAHYAVNKTSMVITGGSCTQK